MLVVSACAVHVWFVSVLSLLLSDTYSAAIDLEILEKMMVVCETIIIVLMIRTPNEARNVVFARTCAADQNNWTTI